MTTRAAVLLAALAACSSSQRSHMYPAGSEKDDGYGDLAQKSARLLTGGTSERSLFAPRPRGHARGDPYGGQPYGGAMYGGDDDGGDASAAGTTPAASGPKLPGYHHTAGLTGALEGMVTWRGAPPPPVVTACGTIENPSVRVSADHAVGGVLVYIEHVDIGRTLPSFGRPVSVGGTVAKRGCVLAPAIQIVTPLPAGLTIHGDAAGVELRVTLPHGIRRFELQQAGLVMVQAELGVTRIEADDDSLGDAWVVGSDTPYYAITDDRGRFRIDELAAGTYDVTFWRPPLATAANGKLIYGAPVVIHRSIRIEAARPARLDVALER